MRSYSTPGWRVWRVAVVLLALVAGHATVALAGDAVDDVVERAIEAAVRSAFGPGIEVAVEALQVAGQVQGEVVAQPEAGARTGVPARFLLFEGRTRVGTATATLRVSGLRVRARRDLLRDLPLAEADLEEGHAELTGLTFQRLPQLSDVRGAQLVRPVVAGETLTAMVVRIPPVVRVGDMVRATIRVGAVEVSAMVMAAGSGRVGDVVRVRGTATKQFLQARVTGRGAVEVLQ